MYQYGDEKERKYKFVLLTRRFITTLTEVKLKTEARKKVSLFIVEWCSTCLPGMHHEILLEMICKLYTSAHCQFYLCIALLIVSSWAWDTIYSSKQNKTKLTIEMNLYWVNCIISWYWYTNMSTWMWTMHFTLHDLHILHYHYTYMTLYATMHLHNVNDKHLFFGEMIIQWLHFTALLAAGHFLMYMDILLFHQAVRLFKCKQYFIV